MKKNFLKKAFQRAVILLEDKLGTVIEDTVDRATARLNQGKELTLGGGFRLLIADTMRDQLQLVRKHCRF